MSFFRHVPVFPSTHTSFLKKQLSRKESQRLYIFCQPHRKNASFCIMFWRRGDFIRTFAYLHNEVESKQKRYDTKYFTYIVGA